MRTLILNVSYEPLCVVSVRRAVVLVMADKAEVVTPGDHQVRSASTSMPAPKVIRLRYFVRVPYRAALPLSNRNVLARDGHRCAYCPAKATTVDHVLPRSRGGSNTWDNVVAACYRCNNRKADRLLSELGWTLGFTPKAPTGWSWLVVGVAATDPDWEPWLSPMAVPA